MRRLPATFAVLSTCAAVIALVAGPASAHDGGGRDDRGSHDGAEFEVELTGSSVGGPILAGAAAGGRPWVITRGEAELDDGILAVAIAGLVIPPGGTNPVASLSVSVVCGNVIAATTATVPFSPTGDASVSQAVTVPSDCAAPQVLVHPGANTRVYIAFG